jgi:hypothetical protein
VVEDIREDAIKGAAPQAIQNLLLGLHRCETLASERLGGPQVQIKE